MRALALDAVGGIEHLAVRELPAPRARARRATCGSGCTPRRSTGSISSSPAGCPGVELRLSAHRRLGRRGRGRSGRARGDAGSPRRPGHDQSRHSPAAAAPPARRARSRSARPSASSASTVPGTAAEFVVVPAENLAPVPAAMPWAQAAAFSLATLTAWRMLTTRARLRAGRDGADLGHRRRRGAGRAPDRQATSAPGPSSPAAPTPSSRPRGGWAPTRRSTTRTADVVAEVRRAHRRARRRRRASTASARRRWQDSLRALRRGGRLVICGATTGPMVSLDLRRLFWHQWSILGSTLGSRREYAEIVRAGRTRAASGRWSTGWCRSPRAAAALRAAASAASRWANS